MLFNIIFVISFLYICDLIGFGMNQHIKIKTNFNIPIGFLTITGIFSAIALPVVLIGPAYNDVKGPLVLLVMGCVVILFVKIFHNIKFNEYFHRDKYYYYIMTILIIFSLFLSFIANTFSDSWLYLPQVLSSIQQNQIFAVTNFIHMYDVYYLFISIMTSIARGNDYLFLVTMYIFIHALIGFTTMFMVLEQVFRKNKKVAILYTIVGILTLQYTIFPYYSGSDFTSLLIINSPNGTFLMYSLLISFAFIIIYNRSESKLLVNLLVLASLSYSSSSLFLLAFSIIIDLCYTYYYEKNSLKQRVKLYDFGYVYIVFMACLYLTNYEKVLTIYFILLVTYLIVHYILKCISNDVILLLMKYGIIAYFCVVVILLIYYNDFSETLADILFGTREDLYPKFGHGYLYLREKIFFTGFVIFGLLKTYKSDRKLFRIILISFIFVTNYLIIISIGNFVGQVVYHRAVQLSFLNIIATIGFVHLFDLTNKYQISKVGKYIIFGIFIYLSCIHTVFNGALLNITTYVEEPYNGGESFYEWKINDPDTIQLSAYDFPLTKDLDVGEISNWAKGINQIFQIKTELNRVDSSCVDCYYLVEKDPNFEDENYPLIKQAQFDEGLITKYDKNEKIKDFEDYENSIEGFVYETDNFYLLYREE